jgi:catechol 2,3-dioxygenase-like lactoylglutathione lyase family enzyme
MRRISSARRPDGDRSRREFLTAATYALVAARHALAQTTAPRIRIRGINHVTLAVSDVKRSVDFYQGLFGMPIIARQGSTTSLQIGAGPQHLGVSAAGSNPPRLDHLALGVEDFNVERISRIVAQYGVTRVDGAAATGGEGLSGGPRKMRVRMRGPEAGGAKDGTPELYVGDPNGFVIQLQDPRYCGGAGSLGNVCAAPARPPRRGLLALRGWSHTTNSVSDPAASRAFWKDLFGLRIQAYQGPTSPVLGWGGVEFLVFNTGAAGRGGSGTPPRAGINHLCMTLENFRADTVIKALETYGIKARGDAPGASGPLVHYISVRREDRGGAREGTPELYFTDPDGLIIQLQDVSYCGGSGVLGNVCS